MVVSLIHPNTCGFAKVIAWQLEKSTASTAIRSDGESLPKFRSRISKLHYENFIEAFSECKENYSISFATFQKRFQDLHTKFVKWNSRKINERVKYLATFETEKWKKLPSSKKAEHSLQECRGCSHSYSYEQSLFPVKSKQFNNCQDKNNFVTATQTANDVGESKAKVKCKKREVTKAARELYAQINLQFQKICQVPLAQALVSVPELQLQQKKSKTEMKKEKRDCYRKVKARIEEEWKETDILRCFGNRQSLKSRQKDRLAQAFEPRLSPEHSQVPEIKRSPVGIFDKMAWDKDALKSEVESYENGKFVNWSQLAKDYNVTNTKGKIAANGGQIVKEWLKSVDSNDTTPIQMIHAFDERRGEA
ncbi:Hypothetical predicted protein [Paramuricea clavata]|uniref:Uncharacterized protein n=1 Tax=Paramuricea clavata TaxID=317549 RepID=A0A7D9I6M0_PARCT|nr:Hypothetical predicted protein [Paramuricea clavata]